LTLVGAVPLCKKATDKIEPLVGASAVGQGAASVHFVHKYLETV